MAPPACSPSASTAASSISHTEPANTPASSFADNETQIIDEYNIQRYIDAQDEKDIYNRVLAAFRAGCRKPQPAKWLWCIFPQMNGCQTAIVRRIRGKVIRNTWAANKDMAGGLDEARAILRHPVLGPRIRAAARAVLDSPAPDVFTVMDNRFYDVARLHSSMTIFRQAARYPVCIHQRKNAVRQNIVFREVLDKYFVKMPDSEDEDYDSDLEDKTVRKKGSRHQPTLAWLDKMELQAAKERLAAHKPCVCGLDSEKLFNKDVGSKFKIVDKQRDRLEDR